MRTVLNVAEKPSAAKEIVGVLARGRGYSSRPGKSKYNRIYDFEMPLFGSPAKMIFTSVSGHLMESDFEDAFRKWYSCDPAELLDRTRSRVVWQVARDKAPLASTLKIEARKCDMLVLWLDCDSEGEKIARDVRDVCVSAKRTLVVKRARFSAMTQGDLFRAVGSLGILNERMVAMVETRQEIDLRAGSAYTRFLTTTLQYVDPRGNSFNANGTPKNAIISYGPCQFPTLGLVFDRWLTIQQFVSRPFWVINLSLHGTAQPFEWLRKQIFDQYSAFTLYELAAEQAEADGSVVHVIKVDKRHKSRWRPLPLSTVDLQKSAARSLRMSSDRVMEVAENLYNKGFISYPRTETDKFGPTYDLKGLIQKQTGHSEWGNFANRLLSPPSQEDIVTFQWPRSGNHDDGAHPPIHPTEAAPSSFETTDHEKLFNYISKRFLAACSVDAQGSETAVQVRVGMYEHFLAKGLIVQHKGWLEVMHPYAKWNEREMPVQLLDQGARLPYRDFSIRESRTQPPPLLSEADLISLMDHYGIGTDATIAQHIKKVLDRNYVRKLHNAQFEPTHLGVSLVTAHERVQLHLARPHMRAEQEKNLKKISTGEVNAQFVLDSALNDYRSKFTQLRNNTNTLQSVFNRD